MRGRRPSRTRSEDVTRRVSSSQPTAAAAAASDRQQGDFGTPRTSVWVAPIQLDQCRRRPGQTVHGIVEVAESRRRRSGRTRPDPLHQQEAFRAVAQERLETQVSGFHTGQKYYSEIGTFSVSRLLRVVFFWIVFFCFRFLHSHPLRRGDKCVLLSK